MTQAIPYLLRSQEQIAAFRKRHAALIEKKGPQLADWFNALPLYEWVRLQCHPGQEELTVGLLCILHLDGKINLTVSDSGERIQRGALSLDEYEEWALQHYGSPPSIR